MASPQPQATPASQQLPSMCGICHDPLQETDAFTRLDCDPRHHVFHTDCLTTWYGEREEGVTRTCPFPFCETDSSNDTAESEPDDDGNELPWELGEMVDMVTQHYRFLVRMYIPQAALKYPPPDGWPNMTPEVMAELEKTDLVKALLRRLPYIEDDGQTNVHNIDFKTTVIDYSQYGAEDFLRPCPAELLCEGDDLTFPDWDRKREHTIAIARGHGNGGQDLLLNTLDGEMIVQVIPTHSYSIDFAAYLWQEQERLRTLSDLPIPGEEIYDGSDLDLNGYIPVDPLTLEDERWNEFPSDADRLWVAYLYRTHGWPGVDYDKEAALESISFFTAERKKGPWQ